MPVIHKPGSIFAIYADSPPPPAQTNQRRPTSPSRAAPSRAPAALGRKMLGSKSTGQSTSSGSATSSSSSKILGIKSTTMSSSSSSAKPTSSSSSFAIPSKKRKTASEMSSKLSQVDKENAPSQTTSSSSSFGKSILGGEKKSPLGLGFGLGSKTSQTISSKSTQPTTSSVTSTNRPALAPSTTSNNGTTTKPNTTTTVPPAPKMGSDDWYFSKPNLRKVKPTTSVHSGTSTGLPTQVRSDGIGARGSKSGGTELGGTGLGYKEKENVPPVGEMINLAPALPISGSDGTSRLSGADEFMARQPLRSAHAPAQVQSRSQARAHSTFTTAFSTTTTSTNTHTRSDSELAIAAAGWGLSPSAPLPMRMISGSGSGFGSRSRDVMQTPLKGVGRASGFAGGKGEGGDLSGLGIGGLSLGYGSGGGDGVERGVGSGGMWAEGVSIGDMSGELEDGDGDKEELLIDDDESVEAELDHSHWAVTPIVLKPDQINGGWTESDPGVWTAPPPPLTARQVQALSAQTGGGRMRRR